MNFKPTLSKTIVSVILGLFGGFFYWAFTFPLGNRYPLINWIISGLIITIILYIIWSLLEKK